MSGHVIWFETAFKNQNFCPWAHLPLYMGVGFGTLAGCANPIILPDLCFTLEMATFELVVQHITWIFFFNIPLLYCLLVCLWYLLFVSECLLTVWCLLLLMNSCLQIQSIFILIAGVSGLVLISHNFHTGILQNILDFLYYLIVKDHLEITR